MFCNNCIKLLNKVTTKTCIKCNASVYNSLSVLCDNCSNIDNVCSACLKKLKNKKLDDLSKSGCIPCGRKTR